MNEKERGGRMRRLVVTLSLVGLGVAAVAGVGAYEVAQAVQAPTSQTGTTSGGLTAGSGSSMTHSGGS